MNSHYKFATRNLLRILLLLAVMILAACQNTFKEYVVQPVGSFLNWDTDIEMQFTVEPDSNPDESKDHTPSPLVVRIYELAGKDRFEGAQFRDIYFDDKKHLGDEFIKKHTLKALLPGTTRMDRFKLKEGTAFVGLFAEFVQYKNADFRVVIPVDEYLTTVQDVRISYHSMSLIKPKYWED